MAPIINSSRTIWFYLRSTKIDGDIDQDLPEDDSKKDWLHDDTWLYIQIKNSIESEVVGLVNHCDSVNELLEFLESLYSIKEQVNRMYEVCTIFFHVEQKKQPRYKWLYASLRRCVQNLIHFPT